MTVISSPICLEKAHLIGSREENHQGKTDTTITVPGLGTWLDGKGSTAYHVKVVAMPANKSRGIFARTQNFCDAVLTLLGLKWNW